MRVHVKQQTHGQWPPGAHPACIYNNAFTHHWYSAPWQKHPFTQSHTQIHTQTHTHTRNLRPSLTIILCCCRCCFELKLTLSPQRKNASGAFKILHCNSITFNWRNILHSGMHSRVGWWFARASKCVHANRSNMPYMYVYFWLIHRVIWTCHSAKCRQTHSPQRLLIERVRVEMHTCSPTAMIYIRVRVRSVRVYVCICGGMRVRIVSSNMLFSACTPPLESMHPVTHPLATLNRPYSVHARGSLQANECICIHRSGCGEGLHLIWKDLLDFIEWMNNMKWMNNNK